MVAAQADGGDALPGAAQGAIDHLAALGAAVAGTLARGGRLLGAEHGCKQLCGSGSAHCR